MADDIGPAFSAPGPTQRNTRGEGYPSRICNGAAAGHPGNRADRVGAFTHIDDIYPTRLVQACRVPWTYRRAPSALTDPFRDPVTGYLARNPVTGLLIARDDQILFDALPVCPTDRDRFVSQSMVKSITGLLIGIAIADGAIKSVDDKSEAYVPGFKGSEYGATAIRDLLHMSSGVEFGEEQDNGRDLNRLWRDMVSGSGKAPRQHHAVQPRIAREGRATTTPASSLNVLASWCVTPPANHCPTTCGKNLEPIGAEADAKMAAGCRKDTNWPISVSTPCRATTPA